MTALIRRAGLLATLGLTAATVTAVPAASATAVTGAAARAAAGPGETVVGWGSDTSGELGDGTTTDTTQPVFAKLPAKLRYTTVRTSEGTSVAVATSGAVFAWGGNLDGQLGTGTTPPGATTPMACSRRSP